VKYSLVPKSLDPTLYSDTLAFHTESVKKCAKFPSSVFRKQSEVWDNSQNYYSKSEQKLVCEVFKKNLIAWSIGHLAMIKETNIMIS
jgi:hypothetical protein